VGIPLGPFQIFFENSRRFSRRMFISVAGDEIDKLRSINFCHTKNPCQELIASVVDTGEQLIADVVDIGDKQ
jgi:hypothetical protein